MHIHARSRNMKKPTLQPPLRTQFSFTLAELRGRGLINQKITTAVGHRRGLHAKLKFNNRKEKCEHSGPRNRKRIQRWKKNIRTMP